MTTPENRIDKGKKISYRMLIKESSHILIFTAVFICSIIFTCFYENNGWHRVRTTFQHDLYTIFGLLSLTLSISIFMVSLYILPQNKTLRVYLSFFTFFVIALVDGVELVQLSFFDIDNPNMEIALLFLSDLLNGMGFFLMVTLNLEKTTGARLRNVMALGGVISLIPAGILVAATLTSKLVFFREGEGLSLLGYILVAGLLIMFLSIVYRSAKNYLLTRDEMDKILIFAFLMMFFSILYYLGMTEFDSIHSIFRHGFKFAAYVLFFGVFFNKSVHRPYLLLSRAKEELREYADELDALVDMRTAELRLSNDKLMADLEIARSIQQSMLPAVLPKTDYITFAPGYIPADKLSGDFYHVFRINEAQYGMCVGDVSGHGVSAAMLSIFSFQKLQSLMEETGGEAMTLPSVVLKHLYDSFNASNFNDDMYTVLLYGVLNVETGIFSYASGGLNTVPLRVRPDGSIQELDNDGFAICKLGSFLKPKFVNHQILLFPGDRLVLYTDGLVDARDPDRNTYSLERLKSVIQKNYKWDAEHLTRSIVNDVTAFAVGKLEDDVTLLTVDVLAQY